MCRVMSTELIAHRLSLIGKASFIGFLSLSLFIILYSLFFIKVAHAQQSTQSGILNQQQTNQYLQQPSIQLSPQSPLYANLISLNLMHTASCILTGISPTYPCIEMLQAKDAQGNTQTVPVLSQGLSGGVFGTLNRFNLAMFTTPPLSTREYIADVANGFGIVDEANAQQTIPGGGNGVLNPIINLWQVSRNVAYLVMIIIFVLIGLMVMFRRKLNPQTVISVQMALPGLIFGLIFITFSYFFASFITDFAFIGTDLVGYYFKIAQPPPPVGQNPATFTQPLSQTLANENVLSVFSRYVGTFDAATLQQGVGTIFDSIGAFPQQLLRLLASVMAYQVGNALGSAAGPVLAGAGCVASGAGVAVLPVCLGLGAIAGGPIGGAAAGAMTYTATVEMLSFAVYIVLIVLVIFSMFRLLFQLVKNYIAIIFLTISAPFHFLLASMPGKSDIAYSWLRNMLCNVLAFPAVIAVLYFVAYLLGGNRPEFANIYYLSQAQGVTGQNAMPLFGQLNVTFLRTVLAIGALLAVPSVPDIICRAIGKVGPYGGMLDKEIGTARGGQRYLNQGASGVARPFKDVSGMNERIWGRRAGSIGTRAQAGFGKAHPLYRFANFFH